MIKSPHLKLLLLLISCLSISGLHAQYWFQDYGILDTVEWTESLVKAPDNGFFLIGKSEYPGPEGFYVYTDSAGNSIWERKIDDIELQLEDGWAFENETFAVCGEAGIPPTLGGYFALIDANGDSMWTEKYPGFDAFSRMTAYDGDYLVAGDNFEYTQVTRLDGNGTVIWHDTIDYGFKTEVFEIDTLRDSGDFMVYMSVTPTLGDPQRMVATRMTSVGDTVWSRHFWLNDLSEGSDAVLLRDSSILIAGGTVDGGNSWMHLIKMASDGSTIWEKEYPGLTASFNSYPISVDESSDGSLIVLLGTAGAGGDRYLVKLDSNGDTLWMNYWNTESTDPKVVLANDNGHYNVAGTVSVCYYTAGLCLLKDNAFIAEADSLGELPDCVSNCVWPGDANYDGVADNFDLLPIGIGYGVTGPYRSGGITWVGQYASNWTDTLAGGVNYKHIDTDGNEIIEEADTLAIYVNYGLTHPLRPGTEQGGVDDPPLYLQVEPDSASSGDTVELVVYLGSDSVVANDVYGIAFSILHDDFFVDTVLGVSYSSCWIGSPGDLLTLTYPSPGRVDIAITRTDGFEASGDGEIVSVKYVLDDDIGGRLNTVSLPANFHLTKVRMINAQEQEQQVFTSGDSTIVSFEPTGVGSPSPTSASVEIFPNPATDYFTVEAESAILELHIYDAVGRLIYSAYPSDPQTQVLQITPQRWNTGVFLVETRTAEGIAHTKLILH